MATVLQGTLGVEDVLAGKSIRDVTAGLNYLYPNLSPIFRVMVNLPSGRVATNPKVEWTQKDHLPRWDTLTTTVAEGTAGAAVVLIPTGNLTKDEYFKVGDVIEVPTRPMAATVTNKGYVTAVSADTSVTVKPVGWQSNADAGTAMKFTATDATDKIHIISDASDEYSQKPTPKVTLDVQEFNYIQFLRAPYIIGNINMDVKKYTGPERTERREETHRDIRIQAEELIVRGDRGYIAGSAGRKYFMRGFHEFIRQGAGSNILNNWSSGLTEGQLFEYLVKGPGMYGGDTKLWFMSNDLYLKVYELASAKQRIQGEVTKLGLRFQVLLAPDGKRYLMRRHHLFVETHAGFGLIVDPQYARLRPYGTQGVMRLLTEIQENDRAGIADEWQVIFSLEVDRIEPHGYQQA
jgi:hypothetical protein